MTLRFLTRLTLKSVKLLPGTLWIMVLFAFFITGFAYNVHAEDYFSRYRKARKAAEEKAKKEFPKGLNPHNQINDFGEIEYKVCLHCHKKVPDLDKAGSIEDVTFRYDKFEDLKELCFTCHPERMHPGGGMMGGSDERWRKFGGAPNHLKKPDEDLIDLMEEILINRYTILPLDPKTGEITCITCHNPHERGLLSGGKGDVGADSEVRLRTDTAPLCVICHDVVGTTGGTK